MKRCIELNMPMVAMVEFAPDCHGTTEHKPGWNPDAGECDPRSAHMRLVSQAARCKGNFDRFAMMVLADAKANGHGSIYISVWEQWQKMFS